MVRTSRLARQRGEKVVFTNGCFDFLHMGHVIHLRRALALGTVLFVGVNSDRSVRHLKGSDRPFNPESDRAGVVAALSDVNLVTIFEEETARALVEEVRPDVYVKGGDYSADPLSPAYPIEGVIVTGYGGVVRILPFEPGYSTTALVERIRGGS